MNVFYQGKSYEVAYENFLSPSFYGLTSRFPGGSVFPAKKTDCRIVDPTVREGNLPVNSLTTLH